MSIGHDDCLFGGTLYTASLSRLYGHPRRSFSCCPFQRSIGDIHGVGRRYGSIYAVPNSERAVDQFWVHSRSFKQISIQTGDLTVGVVLDGTHLFVILENIISRPVAE